MTFDLCRARFYTHLTQLSNRHTCPPIAQAWPTIRQRSYGSWRRYQHQWSSPHPVLRRVLGLAVPASSCGSTTTVVPPLAVDGLFVTWSSVASGATTPKSVFPMLKNPLRTCLEDASHLQRLCCRLVGLLTLTIHDSRFTCLSEKKRGGINWVSNN